MVCRSGVGKGLSSTCRNWWMWLRRLSLSGQSSPHKASSNTSRRTTFACIRIARQFHRQRVQFERDTGTGDSQRIQIIDEISHDKLTFAPSLTTPQDGLGYSPVRPGQRVEQVIIGPGTQAFQPVFQRIAAASMRIGTSLRASSRRRWQTA